MNSLQLKACPPLSCPTMDLPSTETSLDNFSRDFDFIHTTLSPHFHQFERFHWVNGKEGQKRLQEDGWIPQCSGQSIAFSYATHLSWQTYRPQLRSSMDIEHKVQFFQDHPGRSIYIRSTRDLLSLQEKQKEQFDRTHWARDLRPLKVKRTSPILPKQASHRPHQVDNRYCDWNIRMWMILHDPRPQWQTLQMELSSSKAYLSWRHLLSRPLSAERGKTAQRQFLSRPLWSFQDHSGQIRVFQQQSELHRWWSRLYGPPSPWCLTAQRHVKHPQHHQQHHPLGATHLGYHHFHSPASLPSRESSVEPSSEDSSPKGRKRHQSETSLHQTLRHWPRTHTQTFSSPCWNITISPLSMTATGQSQGPRKNIHPQVSHFKTIWLISRPIWLISRPSCVT